MRVKPKSYRIPLWCAAIGSSLCVIAWLSWGIHVYWNDVRLFRFLADWIPFVLAILIAFFPMEKMSTTKKILWRTSLISAGFIWSAVLWHEQSISDARALADQQAAISAALAQANQHSDEKIAEVRGDVKKVQDTAETLKINLGDVSKQVAKTENNLNGSISKVGTVPPRYAQLKFTLWVDTEAAFPLLEQGLSPDKDGVFTVDFSVKNISDVAVEEGELWLILCDQCKYAAEPQGFNKQENMPDTMRLKTFNLLNPGVSLTKMTVKVKVDTPLHFNSFQLGLRFSCKTCGKTSGVQSATINVMPSLNFP